MSLSLQKVKPRSDDVFGSEAGESQAGGFPTCRVRLAPVFPERLAGILAETNKDKTHVPHSGLPDRSRRPHPRPRAPTRRAGLLCALVPRGALVRHLKLCAGSRQRTPLARGLVFALGAPP